MPPKTTEEPTCPTDYQEMAPPCSLASIPTNSYSSSKVPLVDRQEPFVSLTSDSDFSLTGADSYSRLSSRLETLSNRANRLLGELLNDSGLVPSPVLDACRLSLETDLPELLRNASSLIKKFQKSGEEVHCMAGDVRSMLALARAARYLESIETGMHLEMRQALDDKLNKVLDRLRMEVCEHDCSGLRVSRWITSSLAFDVPAGPSALSLVEKSLPLKVRVRPVVELRSSDLLEEHPNLIRLRPCQVSIKSCKHSPRKCTAGSGIVGEACIRVRLSPLDLLRDQQGCVWQKDDEVEAGFFLLSVKEARVTQLNAHPPRPKSPVDMYSSYLYGDAGATVTLFIKTYVTEQNDPPELYVELVLPLSQEQHRIRAGGA